MQCVEGNLQDPNYINKQQKETEKLLKLSKPLLKKVNSQATSFSTTMPVPGLSKVNSLTKPILTPKLKQLNKSLSMTSKGPNFTIKMDNLLSKALRNAKTKKDSKKVSASN